MKTKKRMVKKPKFGRIWVARFLVSFCIALVLCIMGTYVAVYFYRNYTGMIKEATYDRAITRMENNYTEIYSFYNDEMRETLIEEQMIINEMAKQVKEGRNFLIFPEGTRSKNGNRMGEFKSGSFKAATKAKCPIVPIAIIDSYLPFDRNSIDKVDVQIHILPPIPYEEYQGMKTTEIAQMVRSRIEKVITENEHRFNQK